MRRPGIVAPTENPSNPDLMLSWRPGAISCDYKSLQANKIFEYKSKNPTATIIVRFQHPANWFTDLEATAVSFARKIAATWQEILPLDPLVIFANEMNRHEQNGDPDPARQPIYQSEQFYKSAGWWITRVAQIVKALAPQMSLIAPPFAAGLHEDGAPDNAGNITESFAGYDYIAKAVPRFFDNTLAIHAFWGDETGSNREWLEDPALASWHALRWKRVHALFKKRYNIDTKIVIAQAGNFGAYDPDFFEQLIFFTQRTLNDERVKAIAFFEWENQNPSAKNIFNAWNQYIADLPTFTKRLAAVQDIKIGNPPPTTTIPAPPTIDLVPVNQNFGGMDIRVQFDSGHTETMPLESYLRAVVPAEIPATWHPEALKAQAIAARTYTANAIRRARYLNKAFDIRANPEIDQNYRPDKIHPATDRAILATQGLVILYDGHPIDAVYSANCGGHTLNSEDVFKPGDGTPAKPTPYLRGVSCPIAGTKNGHAVGLCQNGANELAKNGFTFDKILRHYYTGVNIARWEYKAGASPALVSIGLTEPGNWTVKISRIAGISLIVGNLADKANIPITVTSPRGESFVVQSGIKPEFGAGGFEAMTIGGAGVYQLAFLSETFSVQVDGKSTVRLDFSAKENTTIPTTPAQKSGINGKLVDMKGMPMENRTVQLQSAHSVQVFTTAANGQFRFENLSAGNYIVSDILSDVKEALLLDGKTSKNVTLRVSEKVIAPTGDKWSVNAIPMPGNIPLLVGDIGTANQPITVIAPSGAKTIVTGGDKAEYGIGGFEIYAPEKGIYTLKFLDRTFSIEMKGQMLRLEFSKTQPEVLARLISSALPLSKINSLLTELKSTTPAGDIFSVEEV